MNSNLPVTIFWFRRDLRLNDNAGLYHALKKGKPVLPLFIFDLDILTRLSDETDRRVHFIHNEIERLNNELAKYGSALTVKIGKPLDVWMALIKTHKIDSVYFNNDYEPQAIARDNEIKDLLARHSISCTGYKDQVIFEKREVIKDDGTPYTVFTPYSKKWKAKLVPFYYRSYPTLQYAANFFKCDAQPVPAIERIGFKKTDFVFPPRHMDDTIVANYHEHRDYPADEGTSKLSLHLRFGTISIRELLQFALQKNETYVNELIWREFYQMILFHFPKVTMHAFKPGYDRISWSNNTEHFNAWCQGRTGYPLVDAGMRQLNATGYMHNRVRMVTASFLTKNLLIDWRWGEAYFAEKLLDFELASNNGGWQWSAGSGTDAAPYFRVFNPDLQLKRFDPQLKYVKQWVPEFGTANYAKPIIDLAASKTRMMKAYKVALDNMPV